MRKNLALSILLLTILFIGCTKKKRDTAAKNIKSYTVKRGQVTVKLEETGVIKPIREIDIKSKVSGKIVKFYVDEGDYVTIGDTIADIEPDYNQAQQISNVKNNLELAKINLENKKDNLADKQKLYEKKFISENDLRTARDQLKEAEINYKSTLQQYNLIKEIETENNISKIISSASGTIIIKPVEEGEMVVSNTGSYSEGSVILKLANLNRMIVETNINEIDIAKIRKNQKVKIQVDAYPYKQYEGKIIKIAAMAVESSNVKVFPIEIEITDVDTKLKPGMTANVTILGEEKKDILVIPIRTIFSDEEGNDIVYKVENDTIAESIKIKTGINDFTQVEVIKGLQDSIKISYSEPMNKKEDEFKFN